MKFFVSSQFCKHLQCEFSAAVSHESIHANEITLVRKYCSASLDSRRAKCLPFYILFELASGEAIFPNRKLCSILSIVCVTPLGIKN